MAVGIKMENISGYILIHEVGPTSISVQSNSKFFAQEIAIKIEHDRIIFKPAGLDDIYTRKARKQKDKEWYQLSVIAEKKAGKYFFDEESTMDKVVVYCK